MAALNKECSHNGLDSGDGLPVIHQAKLELVPEVHEKILDRLRRPLSRPLHHLCLRYREKSWMTISHNGMQRLVTISVLSNNRHWIGSFRKRMMVS